MMLDNPSPGIDDLIGVLGRLRIFQYLEVTGIILFLYDYGVTVIDEIRFIWAGQWNLACFIFLITRYLPFVDTALTIVQQFSGSPSPGVCLGLYTARSWLYFFGLLVSECVLIFRTYVICDNSKIVAWGFTTLLAMMAAGGAYFIQRPLRSTQFTPSPAPVAYPGCVAKGSDDVLRSFLIFAAYELAIMLFTWYKVARYNMRHESILMRTLGWDGLISYGSMFGTSILNVIVLRTAPPELEFSLIVIQRSIHAIISSRLIIRLREAAFAQQWSAAHGISTRSLERFRDQIPTNGGILLEPIQFHVSSIVLNGIHGTEPSHGDVYSP